jgi:hypothetical protein
VSDTAILVTGAVALGVPCVAALWARSTQETQLAHDRETRELEELRRLFDDAVDHVVEADIALSRWGSDMLVEPLLLDDEDRRRRAYAERDEFLQAAGAARFRVVSSLEHLGMRLGRDASVVQRYAAVAAALEGFVDAAAARSFGSYERITKGRSERSDEEVKAEIRDWMKALDVFHTARWEFVDEATKLIGSHLPREIAEAPPAAAPH